MEISSKQPENNKLIMHHAMQPFLLKWSRILNFNNFLGLAYLVLCSASGAAQSYMFGPQPVDFASRAGIVAGIESISGARFLVAHDFRTGESTKIKVEPFSTQPFVFDEQIVVVQANGILSVYNLQCSLLGSKKIWQPGTLLFGRKVDSDGTAAILANRFSGESKTFQPFLLLVKAEKSEIRILSEQPLKELGGIAGWKDQLFICGDTETQSFSIKALKGE